MLATGGCFARGRLSGGWFWEVVGAVALRACGGGFLTLASVVAATAAAAAGITTVVAVRCGGEC